MGLETGNRIEDLDPQNPVGATDDVNQGDDHIRLLKICVQGSLPSLGPNPVTKTAEQINTMVQTFNSRAPDVDGNIAPQGGDYNIGQLGNVDVTPTNDGDVLVYNATSTNWESTAPSALPQTYPESGWYNIESTTSPGLEGGTLYFPGVTATDQTGSLATVKNDNTGGTGWRLTANQRIVATLSYSWAGGGLSDITVGIDRFNSPSTFQLASFTSDNPHAGCISASTFLPIGATLQFPATSSATDINFNRVSISLIQVA